VSHRGGAAQEAGQREPDARSAWASQVQATFAPAFAPAATLVRAKGLRGGSLRTRWTVTQPGGAEAVGFKGRIFWWCMWWLLLPMRVLILAFSVFDSVPGNEGGVARGPRRIRWRGGGQMPLEFRSKGDKLHVHAPGMDWRLGAVLVVLLRTFGSGSWDSLKR
jgi:hypothetical protein